MVIGSVKRLSARQRGVGAAAERSGRQYDTVRRLNAPPSTFFPVGAPHAADEFHAIHELTCVFARQAITYGNTVAPAVIPASAKAHERKSSGTG